jgi:hypothetical protein
MSGISRRVLSKSESVGHTKIFRGGACTEAADGRERLLYVCSLMPDAIARLTAREPIQR